MAPDAHLTHPRASPGLSETALSLAFSELRGARAATLEAAGEATRALRELHEAQRHTRQALDALAAKLTGSE